MLPPIPRCSGWVSSSLVSPSRISLPRYGSRVGLHIVLFEACSAFTRVAACTLALSPNRDTLIEGFSHFVTSMTAPIASGGSESPGGACTHWKAPPCHGARQLPTSGEPPLRRGRPHLFVDAHRARASLQRNFRSQICSALAQMLLAISRAQMPIGFACTRFLAYVVARIYREYQRRSIQRLWA
jgi:hypothetical protein